MDSNCVEFFQPFGLREFVADEMGVEILQVRETDELGNVRIIPDISFEARVLLAPLFCTHAEQGHVKHIGFGCVYGIDLRLCQFRRDQVFLYGIGMNSVVDLCEIAPDIPAELPPLFLFEALEFLDEVEFELNGDPRCEFKGDILMGECAAVSVPASR